MPEPPSLELVLRRNSIERLKAEKQPVDVMNELPELIERGYEAISEEDIVRFMWYGLYHDKPKVGYFMMRIKVPSGILTPAQLRTIGELSQTFGRGDGEITTRQTIQLHWIRLDDLPAIFAKLEDGRPHHARRLRRRGPQPDRLPGRRHRPDELFDATDLIAGDGASSSARDRDYLDLPRKHKITISTCPHQCNAPGDQLHRADRHDQGRAPRLRGPRRRRPLDRAAHRPRTSASSCRRRRRSRSLRAIVDAWRTNLQYRLSRVKARLKFMVDDFGAEGMRAEVEKFLGRKLEDLDQPPQRVGGDTEHLGINPSASPASATSASRSGSARSTGQQLHPHRRPRRVGRRRRPPDPPAELHRRQRARTRRSTRSCADDRRARLPARRQPRCTRPRSAAPARRSATTRSPRPRSSSTRSWSTSRASSAARPTASIVNVDGCPHACAQHWVADIGLQGTTLRERGDAGEKLEAYEIYLRGALGETPRSAARSCGACPRRRPPSTSSG